MSKRTGIPAYFRHSSGQARVRLKDAVTGRRQEILLGKFGSKESRIEYGFAIQRWEAAGRRLVDEPAVDLVINEVLARFCEHAEQHYRHPDGSPTGEFANYLDAIRPLKALYGTEQAVAFGPLKLKAIQRYLAESGLARTTINYRVDKIKRIFKWAASEELIPVTVAQALKTVTGLQRGRTRLKRLVMLSAARSAGRPSGPRTLRGMSVSDARNGGGQARNDDRRRR